MPTPIALPNSTVHFLIDPMDDFLADNRRTHATSMIPGYRFRQCRRVNEGITYCPKRSYILATERPSCLLALYAGNMLEVASLCPISKMTGSYFVASLSPRHYIVYNAEPVVTRTSCVLAEVENHVVTLPAGLREVELRSDCYLVSRDFSLYPSIEIQPLEELHSKVLLPVDKLANFSEPLVWANDKGTLDEDENDDNPSLADISRDWKYEKLEFCLLYTSPSPRDKRQSRMPSSA